MLSILKIIYISLCYGTSKILYRVQKWFYMNSIEFFFVIQSLNIGGAVGLRKFYKKTQLV